MTHEVADESIDSSSWSRENTTNQQTILAHRLLGIIPFDAVREYIMMLDLDANATTGGMPSDLGFPTGFRGAELVTRVLVHRSDEFQVAEGRVWKFEGGAFIEVTDPEIRADLFLTGSQPNGGPVGPGHHVVSIRCRIRSAVRCRRWCACRL